MRHSPRLVSARAVAGVSLALIMGVAGAALSPSELAGKQIYTRGTSPRGTAMTAYLGAEALQLPASSVPCVGCHGYDGLGRPEGGVIPPDIRWSHLTKPYGHVHDNGRSHAAFDPATLAGAVTAGLDPAGNRLDQAMPVYTMSDADMADLIAYLQRLETDLDPGIDEDRIQVATLLPLQGSNGDLGQAMAQVIHAFIQELNLRGGIYGRRVDLLTIPYGGTPEETIGSLRLALQREGIFALVGAYIVDLDAALLDLLRKEKVPLVGPFTLEPLDETLNEAAFYIYPGFTEQARVLVDQALEQPAAGVVGAAVVAPRGHQVDALVEAVQDQMGKQGLAKPAAIRYEAEGVDPGWLADQVREDASDTLFFFGSQADLDLLLPALVERQHIPRVFLLSSFVSPSVFDAPPGFDQRIFLAYPTLPSDVSDAGRSEYQELAARHALPVEHLEGQVAAFAAVKLLVEGVKRAGRDLSRRAFVDGLEALYDYETGVTPPLSYGPNRRVGARGAHVVAVDLANGSYQPIGGWHEIR
jgi:ABC-type branched-subunit amino acid transport system substrate-binding protein